MKYKLFIPPNMSLQIKTLDSNHVEVGPIIGVFVKDKKVENLSRGRTDSVYEEISRGARKLHGISCFFSMEEVDWNRKIVKAMVFEGSKWRSSILPLPEVMYDRCFGDYGHKYAREFRERLGDNYHVVNSMPKLAKLETMDALSKNKNLIKVLPKTIVYHQSKDIEDMVNKCDSVYLKPDALYKGKGIYRISKECNKGYKVEHRNDDENEVIYLKSLDKIENMICEYAKAGGGYLVQTEIKKASYHNQPFDFRLLYQKDYEGIWQPTGIAVRMGAPGSIITSPRSGGAVVDFPTLLKEVFHEDIHIKGGLYEEVITIGREVAETIEREFGDCVELGLDMTIDIYGKVWIIEVNGKPLKVSLKRLNDPELMVQCYCRPVEYAVFLTGFISDEIK